MTGPRPINDGARAGWGLLATAIGVYGAVLTVVVSIPALLWKWWRSRRG